MDSRTLIEIEGGIFLAGGGRHNRGGGYAKDAEKYLEAALAGWTVLRLTSAQLEIGYIERIVALLNSSRTTESGWLESNPVEGVSKSVEMDLANDVRRTMLPRYGRQPAHVI